MDDGRGCQMECAVQNVCCAEAVAVTAIAKSVYKKEDSRGVKAMTFDPQEMFANLAEKEKIKGHHSPEGRAIRTLSRALNGWSTRNLSSRDVLVLCDQAMEDWLKNRLKVLAWAMPSRPELLAAAVQRELITRMEAVRLQRIHNARSRLDDDGGGVAARVVESALEVCIPLVERHW